MLLRRRLRLGWIGTFCFSLLCLGFSPLTAQSQTDSVAQGITVAFPQALPPYVIFEPKGGIIGQRAEIWALWSEQTGIPVTLRQMPWADLPGALKSGQITVADGVSHSAVRDTWLDFSPSYATVSLALFYDTHLAPVTDLASLRGQKVGAVKNGMCETVLSAEGITPVIYPLISEMMAAASKGNPQIFCLPQYLGDDLFAASGLANHYVHTPPIKQTNAHWAVAQGDASAYRLIADGFDRISHDDLDAVIAHWNREQIPALLGYSTDHILRMLQILALMVLVSLLTALVLRWRLGRALAARSAVADALRQRIREQTCLHAVFAATEDMSQPRAHMLADIARALTDAWRIADGVRFRITLRGVTHDEIPPGFSGRTLRVPIEIQGQYHGDITVALLAADKPDGSKTAVSFDILPEEQLLVELVASRIAGRIQGAVTRDQLLKSEERFRHTFQHSAQATAVIRGGIFAEANAASLTMLGYMDGRGFIGRRPSEISPDCQPDGQLSQAKEIRLLAQVVQRGSLKFEWEHLRADGTPILMEVMLTAVHQDDRTDIFVLWNDITVKREAESALAAYQSTLEAQVAKRTDDLVKLNDQLHAILATANSGIALVRKRVIETCNPSLSKLLMWPEDRLIGASTREFYTDDAHWNDRAATIYTALSQGETVVSEDELVRGDGTTILVSIRATAIDPRHLETGIVYVLNDISQERAATQKLAELRDIAEQSVRLKSEFLARMSHELRSPINAVLGFTELLLGSSLADHQLEHVQKVQASGRHLLMIINDILDLSKVEAGKLRIETTEFQLSKVLKSAIDTVANGAADKDIELILSVDKAVPGRLMGDPLRLTQILMNYLTNALKFTRSGEITLSVAPDPLATHPGSLRFSVTDTGIGMSPEQLSRLFQSFSQAEDSTARLYGGTGLGLAICQQLSSLMGGEVGVTSTPDQGSTFWVTLPMTAATTRGRTPRIAAPLRDRRVIVVDDNPRAADMVATMLTAAGATVTTAPSGLQLIDAFKAAHAATTPFDVAIIDSKMPAPSGPDCVALLRDTGLPLPALVLMCKHGGQEAVETAYRTGFDDLITKPVEAEVVVDRVSALLHRGKDRRRRNDKPAVATPPRSAAVAHPPTLFQGRHALVVDDNPMNVELAAALLIRQGLTVTKATNGAEAIQALLDHSVDLILMDSQMPVMGGIEATRRIRALPTAKSHVPIIGLTGKSDDADRSEGLAAGMTDYLVKPVSPSQLKEVLLKHLARDLPVVA